MTAAVASGNGLVRDRTTWLMYAGLGYLSVLISSVGPALPFLRDELGISHTVASLHFSAFATGFIVSGMLTDRIARRAGRRATFWTGAAGLTLGGVIVACGIHPVISIGGTLTLGLFGGALLSMTSSVLSDLHGERRATALVEGNVVAGVTGAVAPLLIGGMAAVLTFRLAFVVPAVVAVVAAWSLRAVPLPAPPAPATSRLEARLPAAFWLFFLVLFLADCLEFSMTAWGATYLREVTGLGTATAATAASLFLVGMLTGRVAGSRLLLAGRDPRILLTVSLITAGTGFLLFRLGPAVPLTLSGLLVTGLGIANLWPLTLSFALGTAGPASDKAGSRASLAAGAGILTAPLALGAAADHLGIATAYWIVVPMVLVALVTVTAAHAANVRSV